MRLWRTAGVLATAAAAACAHAPQPARPKLAAPDPVSQLYSGVSLELTLAVARDQEKRCTWSECDAGRAFDERVTRLGARLAAVGAALYPREARRLAQARFEVAEKAEPGTASAADGRVVVFRPVDALAPTDAALGFVLARELGHYLARHHDEDTATGMLVSLLTHLLLPASTLARLFSDVLPASTAATAASLAGSQLAIAAYRPQQREEADAIALRLLGALGFEAPVLARALPALRLARPESRWMSELRDSVARLVPPAARPVETALAPGAPEAVTE